MDKFVVLIDLKNESIVYVVGSENMNIHCSKYQYKYNRQQELEDQNARV